MYLSVSNLKYPYFGSFFGHVYKALNQIRVRAWIRAKNLGPFTTLVLKEQQDLATSYFQN